MISQAYDLTATPATDHLVGNYGRFPVRFVRGAGVYLYDDQDRQFLDALSGIAVNSLGHGHPALTQAISEQAGQLLHTSNLFHIGPQESLAELICANSFGDAVYFCNSGAEANESALKVSRLWNSQVHHGSKPRVIAAEGAFHGRTMGALSLTGTPAYHKGFEPLFTVDFVSYGDAQALEQAIGDDVAAVFLEPVQGEGGVKVPPAGYLKRARELCDQHQALLCFDEVQVGCGRCGTLFAHQAEGVIPDTMQLAKALGGGVPIGALVLRQELAELLKPGTHASTFGGNHLACAAGTAVMNELLADGFLSEVEARGAELKSGLRTIFGEHAREVRGRGLLIGAALKEAPAPIMQAALRYGLVCGAAGDNVLRLAPPLTITAEEVQELLERLQAAVSSLNS